MKNKIVGIVICILLFSSTITLALTPFKINDKEMKNEFCDTTPVPLSPPNKWMKTFGGSGKDEGYSVQQTTDDGYIITGYTNSFELGSPCLYLLKTDGNGNQSWMKTFGEAKGDIGYSVQQTIDGGFIVTGLGWGDVYLLKTDSRGNIEWVKTFGNSIGCWGLSVLQTLDGGYIIVGEAGVINPSLNADVLLIKTDNNGDKQWERTFGGIKNDSCSSIQQTIDSGYIITGYTGFGGNDSDVDSDLWLIKTDGNGNMIWNKTFGGIGFDYGWSVQQTMDEGYIITGMTHSFGNGEFDVWVIKTDTNGNEKWNRTYGGRRNEVSRSIEQTTDGGYVLVGWISSSGAGGCDVWLIKTNSKGDELWNRTFGGADFEYGYDIQQTSDTGYIIVGCTTSSGVGDYDILLIKTDENGLISNPPNTPTITGLTNGKTQTSYNYSIQTTDPDQDDVKYRIDWGDNTTTTTGLNESGKQIVVSHTWNVEGTYSINVKAVDIYGAESDWATLTVTMPYSYNPMLQFLERLFERFPNAFPILRQPLNNK